MDPREAQRIADNKRKAETSKKRYEERQRLAAENGGVIKVIQEGKEIQQCIRCGTWTSPEEFEHDGKILKNCQKCQSKSKTQKDQKQQEPHKTRTNESGETERQCTNCSTWSVCKYMNCDNCRASRNRCRDPKKNSEYQAAYRARKRAQNIMSM